MEVKCKSKQINNRKKRFFSDFTNNSTVHGVKYLGEASRHWAERVFWFTAFFVSVIGCSIMIHKIYDKWQLSPVIIGFAEKPTAVWQIPFPAVTICPETKVLKSHVDFTKVYFAVLKKDFTNITSNQMKTLEAVSHVCEAHLFAHKAPINSGLQTDEIVPLLRKVSVPLNESIEWCLWQNNEIACDKVFTEIITEEGICYSFNVLDSKQLFKEEILAENFKYLNHNLTSNFWTLEEGYKTKDPETYPRRVLNSGTRADLTIYLKLTESDLDYQCRGPVQGFKILLHSPDEFPRVSKQYFRVPLRQEVVVSVKPNMITTSSGLADYAPERRQCYFNDERHLKFFKVYTQSNCELECLANFTLKACGCVKFSTPRDNRTRVCTQAEITCYDAAEDNLKKIKLHEVLGVISSEIKNLKTNCNCLPSCTSINYDAEISKNELDFVKLYGAYGVDQEEFRGTILTRLTIYFKDEEFMALKRSELYSWSEFLANCGGILGLFMGVSILSLIEILYYVTLRLACSKKKGLIKKRIDRRDKRNNKNENCSEIVVE